MRKRMRRDYIIYKIILLLYTAQKEANNLPCLSKNMTTIICQQLILKHNIMQSLSQHLVNGVFSI